MKSVIRILSALALICAADTPSATAAEKVDFSREIKPLFEVHCLKCHGGKKPKGGLSLESRKQAFAEDEMIVPGKPDDSILFELCALPEGDDDVMPPTKEGLLNKAQVQLLKNWIQQGAKWPANAKLEAKKKANFVKEVQPILEYNCVTCHREDYDRGGYKMHIQESMFAGGDSGEGVVPGNPGKSWVHQTLALPEDDDLLMPPKKKGGPLPKEEIEIIRLWIQQGAWMPKGITLEGKKKDTGPATDEAQTVRNIRELAVKNQKEKTQADMKEYKLTIPGTETTFTMTPIPAGEFLMGSPAGEAKRNDDEGPQRKVKVDAFWMGKFEVTWNEFELFMYRDEERKYKDFMSTDPAIDKISDAVARPTQPYVEMSFGMGKDGYPAISMTQHAARKYCEWMSAKVGQYFRLPTEAEWEYACRAGTTTAYHFGDDPAQIGEYGWFEFNADFKYQKVGKKKPNQFGLFDMHGNVAEWVMDKYEPNYKSQMGAGENPYNRPVKLYPRVARGGSWDHPASVLRSSARLASDEDWKVQDPQLPKSIWYHTDAQFLGFRLVRPLKIDAPEKMLNFWNDGIEKED
jgi:formylglycine-generating enzyme required for sulfatase activity/mono/diheme cytochrome c family protein